MDTGSNMQLVVNVWRGKLAWYLMVKPKGGRKYVAARGICERPSDPVDDTIGRCVMEAAYDAYRACGE